MKQLSIKKAQAIKNIGFRVGKLRSSREKIIENIT